MARPPTAAWTPPRAALCSTPSVEETPSPSIWPKSPAPCPSPRRRAEAKTPRQYPRVGKAPSIWAYSATPATATAPPPSPASNSKVLQGPVTSTHEYWRVPPATAASPNSRARRSRRPAAGRRMVCPGRRRTRHRLRARTTRRTHPRFVEAPARPGGFWTFRRGRT